MTPPDLLPPDAGLAVTAVTITPGLIAVAAATHAPTTRCPHCDHPSDRVHGRYTPTVADLPWQGRRIIFRVTARRFGCRTAGCHRAGFCEPATSRTSTSGWRPGAGTPG